MIKVIKDLATAFVPSGKLIEFVDTFLVSWLSLFQNSSEKKKIDKSEETVSIHYISSLFFQPLIVDTLPYPFNEELQGIATASEVPLGM